MFATYIIFILDVMFLAIGVYGFILILDGLSNWLYGKEAMDKLRGNT